MIYSLSIHGSPGTSHAARSAYLFAREAINSGHEIYRVFFYHDGVNVASTIDPATTSSLQAAWVDMRDQYSIELTICISAATRRGLIDEADPNNTGNIHTAFKVVGLGQLIDGIMHSDRFITFAE